MKADQELVGKEAQLPDGQKVVIEEVEDGFATVRRIEGEGTGAIAICAVESLMMEDAGV